MTHITAFGGVRFKTDNYMNLAEVFTSPYDVICKETDIEFPKKNSYIMIQLDHRNNPWFGRWKP